MERLSQRWHQRTESNDTNAAIGLCKLAAGASMGWLVGRIDPALSVVLSVAAFSCLEFCHLSDKSPSRRWSITPLVKGLQFASFIMAVRAVQAADQAAKPLAAAKIGPLPEIQLFSGTRWAERARWSRAFNELAATDPAIIPIYRLAMLHMAGALVSGGILVTTCFRPKGSRDQRDFIARNLGYTPKGSLHSSQRRDRRPRHFTIGPEGFTLHD